MLMDNGKPEGNRGQDAWGYIGNTIRLDHGVHIGQRRLGSLVGG